MTRRMTSKTAAAALAATMVVSGGSVMAHRSDGDGAGAGHMGRGMGSGMMMGQGTQHGMMGQGMMGQGMGPGMMMGGGMGPYMAGVLGLSEQQRERLDTIEREGARKHWQLMQEMHEHGQHMMELYGQATPDPEAVGQAWSKMADARRRMLEQQVRMNNRMREVLTEEQRERLDEMRRFGGAQQ